MKILHVDSSIVGARSTSRELSRLVLERLVATDVDEITDRDLVAEDLPHFDVVTAPYAHPLADVAATLDSEQQRQPRTAMPCCVHGGRRRGDLRPMYNFLIPPELKAWFDPHRPGFDVPDHEGRPEGLAGGMRVVLEILRCGLYEPRSENDILCPFSEPVLPLRCARQLGPPEHERRYGLSKRRLKAAVPLSPKKGCYQPGPTS